MKNHGRVKSTIKPKDLVVDENSVWVASEIMEVSENIGEESEFVGYEYVLTQYKKDEYIVQIEEQRKLDKLENDLAMAELAETVMGGMV